MDWSALLNTILIPGLIGLGGLFVWYVKFQVPKNDARKDAKHAAELKRLELELEARLENQKDRREHQQQAENIAIEVLRDIIRESIQESSKESQEMRETIYRLGRQVDNNTQSTRAMAGIISEKG